MKSLLRFLYEHSELNPFWSAWFVGYCYVDCDGKVRITASGQEYLEGLEA